MLFFSLQTWEKFILSLFKKINSYSVVSKTLPVAFCFTWFSYVFLFDVSSHLPLYLDSFKSLILESWPVSVLWILGWNSRMTHRNCAGFFFNIYEHRNIQEGFMGLSAGDSHRILYWKLKFPYKRTWLTEWIFRSLSSSAIIENPIFLYCLQGQCDTTVTIGDTVDCHSCQG